MKERPAIFNAFSVRAILAGRKTQTRRLHKLADVGDRLWVRETFVIEDSQEYQIERPTDGRPVLDDGEGRLSVPHYRATEPEPHIVPVDRGGDNDRTVWRPSIFMPRWASRITLEVVAVRQERLQDISESDARAEGCVPTTKDPEGDWLTDGTCRSAFVLLWADIHGWKDAPGSRVGGTWADNPEVWVTTFKRGELADG